MKKSLPSLLPTELDKFGVPEKAQLQRLVVVSATISKIIAIDDAAAAFHHKLVHYGICFRYGLALAVAADEKAYAAFRRDDRIKGLARPPKDPSDILRSLFSATYADPKKASKYFKRIEPFWLKRSPIKTVLSFLQNEGLSDSPTGAAPARPPSTPERMLPLVREAERVENLPVAAQGDRSHKSLSGVDRNDPPSGSIVGWPTKARVGKCYKLIAKITENVGEATIFELLKVPELLG